MTVQKNQTTRKKISCLELPDDARELLISKGFKELYPPQEAAVDAGLLEGKSLLISAPTASGKTLIATLAIISHLARGGRRVAYMSPLRALATEKYVEFSALSDIVVPDKTGRMQKEESPASAPPTHRITAARVTGERGNGMTSGKKISDADVVVCTNESLDAAMRRNHAWVDEVDLVIADEVHLIGDDVRGPTLEMILTQLKRKQRMRYANGPDNDPVGSHNKSANNAVTENTIQIVGLSATIQNDAEIARWLGCRLVKSQWRPVPLAEGVCDGLGNVIMNNNQNFAVDVGSEGLPAGLGAHAVTQNNGQSLIFVATRPSARATAMKASGLVAATLSDAEKTSLAKIAEKLAPGVLAAMMHGTGNKDDRGSAGKQGRKKRQADTGPLPSNTTELERDLAVLVSKGVAFHHAGLSEKMRQIIESEFRNGLIKLLASTPTLAAGVNLPARRVVISSLSRYDTRAGRVRPVSVLEYKQFCGRAGRPQYDQYGEAIICATDNDCYTMLEQYVNGEPEPLESRIVEGRAMRTHLLTVVVLNPGITKDGIVSFFLDTLGGHQSLKHEVTSAVDVALEFLIEHAMIASKGKRYASTLLGKKTSSLYVDPVTAVYLLDVARGAPMHSSGDSRHTLGFLYAITCCDEFNPKQSLLKNHYQLAETLLSGPRSSELLYPVYAEECSRNLLVLYDWILERTDKEIETAYKTQAGDLYRMVESSAWLVYVLSEMAKHAGRTDLLAELAILRLRIRSGIKEELVDLARMRGVGRIRARALCNAGIKNADDIRKTRPEKLATIRQIGPVVAASIKRAAASHTIKTVRTPA